MSSPALAILWEIWRKNRPGLIAIVAAIPVWALLSRALCGPLQPAKDDALAMMWPVLVFLADVVPMWFSLLALAVIFCYTEADPQRGYARFPSRLFALPVRTIVLVTCPILYGIAAVVLVAFAWDKLVLVSLPPVEWMPGHFMPLIFVAAAMVLLQATVWSLPGFPASRLIVLGVLLFGLTWLTAWPVAHSGVGDWPTDRAASFHRGSAMALAGVSVLAYLAALMAVERDRHGGWSGWTGWRQQIRRLIDALPRRQKPFRSPAGAQLWFEWRRGGWLLPFTVGFFMALVLGPIAGIVKLENPQFSVVIDPESTVTMLCVVLALPPVLAFFVGKRHAEKELTQTPFHFLRPMTSGAILLRKLQVAAWSATLAWLLVLAVTPLWLALWCDTSLLARGWRMLQATYPSPALYALLPLALITIVALTWRWLVVSLYLGLWGRPKIFLWAVGSSVVGGWLLLIFAGSQIDHPKQPKQWLETLPWLGILLALKWLVAGWAFRTVHRRGLLTARAIWTYFGIWLGVTVCLVALALMLFSPTSVPKPVIVLGATLIFPLARIGLAPLALEAHRHR
jgi:hypothetical protein